MMRKALCTVAVLLLLAANAFAQLQVADAADPSLFHFFESEQFLTGPGPAGKIIVQGCARSDSKVRTIKFGDYIYAAWLDVNNNIAVACVGSTHLKEIAAGTGTTSSNVRNYGELQEIFNSNSSPCMAVFHNKLYVIFIDNGSNSLWGLTISNPGDLPLTPGLEAMPGNISDITDLSATTNNQAGLNEELILTGRSPATNKIRTILIGNHPTACIPIFSTGNLLLEANETSSELSTSFVGICRMDSTANLGYYVAWTGTDATHHLNTSTINPCGVLNTSAGGYNGKFTYTDRSSCSGGVELFVKEGAPVDPGSKAYEEVHALWRGICGDTKIYQGVFGINGGSSTRSSFAQYVLLADVAQSNVSPALLSLNSTITYLVWPDATYNGSSQNYPLRISKGYDYTYSAWMANMVKDEHTLRNLVLPGSNNAGMNDVQQVSKHFSFYEAAELPDFGQCNECGFVTQYLTVADQLRSGHRYFGITLTNGIYSSSDIGNTPYTADGDSLHSGVQPIDHYASVCIGEGFDTTLVAISNFLAQNNRELVILNIKDLIPAGNSTTPIENYLATLLPKYKSILYQPSVYEHSLADILSKPVGELRGKLVLTLADTAMAGHLNMLSDIFEVSDMNQYRYHDKYTRGAQALLQDQQGFITNPQYHGSYKRLDWYTQLTLQKIACDLKPVTTCPIASKPGLWHHIMHGLECSTYGLIEFTKTIADALEDPEDPRQWAKLAGGFLYKLVGSSMEAVMATNRQLYPAVYDMRASGMINKGNFINIIYTDAADAQYTDLCLQNMYDFNDQSDLSAYNGSIKVAAQVIPTNCGDTASGSAVVEVTGGHPPYKYYWEDTHDTTAGAGRLTEGHHRVRIKDALGHTVTQKVYIPLYSNTHSGIAMHDTFKTEVQPSGLSNYYETGCEGLIARLESNHSTSGVADLVTARVWIDAASNGMHVRRHYEIMPSRGWNSASGRVTLYFTQDDFDNYNATNPASTLPKYGSDEVGKGNVMIQYRGGTSNNGSGSMNSYVPAIKEIFPHAGDVVWNDVTQRWEVSFIAQSFGGFFLSTYDGSLPDSWLQANAYMRDSKPVVSWQVQEKNIAVYEVEYAFDGRNFMAAGLLGSKGHGRNEYQLIHDLQLPVSRIGQQVVYYRIRQKDNNGESRFSRILPVYIGGTATLCTYPNPFSNTLNIITNTDMQAMLCDMTGKTVVRLQLQKGNNVVSGDAITPGLYLLKTPDGGCHKIVKNR